MTLSVTIAESGQPDFGVSLELDQAALSLDWKNLSQRYLIPVFERLRHRKCGESHEACVVPDEDYYV